MSINKHGCKVVLFFLVATLLFALLGVWMIAGIFGALAAGLCYFFRDPERIPVKDGKVVVSPADGTVMEIAHVTEAPLLGSGDYTKIGIFLALYNVHVNRAPVSGVIEKVEYKAGRFVTAMRPDSSHINESNNVVITMADGVNILMRQIAGVVARRIVFDKKCGDRVEQGERVGIIMLGSRTEIFLPADRIDSILVREGEKVAGGLTKLILLKT